MLIRVPFAFRIVLPSLFYISLGGCAVVDQYSGRAVFFNLEAEQAQEQALLLNIVRASMRRPLQYTTVQTISGQATASSSASITVPFGPHSNLPSKTGVFGGSITEGPTTFAVPVLDTQDFYRGVLNPIPPQFIDLYIQSEYSRELLFNLFVEKIVMTKISPDCSNNRHSLECEFVFRNYVGQDMSVVPFQAMVRYLVDLGMTTEPINRPGKGSSKSKAPADSGSTDPSSSTSSNKASDPLPDPFALCFEPTARAYERYLDIQSLCARQPHLPANRAASGEIKGTALVPLNAIDPCFIKRLGDDIRSGRFDIGDDVGSKIEKHLALFSGSRVTLKVYTRSTDGLIYYLGSLVRRELYPDYLDQRQRTIKTRRAQQRLDPEAPANICAAADEPPDDSENVVKLFVVETDTAPSNEPYISVGYNGTRFSVHSPRFDRAPIQYESTTQVLELTKQLLALNSSAKSLPTTNILSVVTNP